MVFLQKVDLKVLGKSVGNFFRRTLTEDFEFLLWFSGRFVP